MVVYMVAKLEFDETCTTKVQPRIALMEDQRKVLLIQLSPRISLSKLGRTWKTIAATKFKQ